jgi:pyrimidine operon attenuation protein/uracil phosphoribosyltransferase|tara:strand:+ start:8438 stop:9013 length:576 start_codon:yes stop_codon:yes gene_type:complete
VKKLYLAFEMQSRTIIDNKGVNLTITRLCYQLIENHQDFSNTILIALQPRGTFLLDRIIAKLKEIKPDINPKTGSIDITFYRDDFRRGNSPIVASRTNMEHSIEGRRIVLVDDVLYTGRSVRSAMDALLDFGRPIQVELLVFIDRRFKRHLPIQPEYVGSRVDSLNSERVIMSWDEKEGKDEVQLYTIEEK